jgi:hypothetical protein
MAVVGMCALSGAAAFWLNAGVEPPITDPSPAPGLLEWAAALAASAWPSVALAKMFAVWHGIAVVAAAGLSALAVFRFTQSLTAGLAVGLAAAASEVMVPSLAPPDVTAIAVSAATACAILGGGSIGPFIGLAIGAAIAPALILPIAVLILGWRLKPRFAGSSRARKAVAAMLLLAVAGGAAALSLPVIARAGPLTIALAVLGVFAVTSASQHAAEPGGRRRLILALGFPAAGVAAVLISGVAPVRTVAPLIVGLWLLVGAGIAEIISGSRGRQYRGGGIAIAAIFAAIQLAPRINPPPSAAEHHARLGHESLTRRRFQELLYQVPAGSALVADDAVTDVLLRSLQSSLERAHKNIRIVARTADDVAAAKEASRVFALPRAQSELQERGVRFAADPGTTVPGLAEVAAIAPCDTLTTAWRPIPSAAGVSRLAMVAGTDEARGPIVVYTGGPAAIDATANAWPRLAMRGFYTRSYDRSLPERRQGLADEVANDSAPADAAAVSTPHVARIELWRVPGAPHALLFDLSAPATAVVATQLSRGTGPIQLCPVFPFAVRPFGR